MVSCEKMKDEMSEVALLSQCALRSALERLSSQHFGLIRIDEQ